MTEATLHYTVLIHLPSLTIGVGLGVILAALGVLAGFARKDVERDGG